MAAFDNEVPKILRHAHHEVLLALWAETDEDEAVHRGRADSLMRAAVREISDDPQRSYDWAVFASGR